jgi:hypothetical protein
LNAFDGQEVKACDSDNLGLLLVRSFLFPFKSTTAYLFHGTPSPEDDQLFVGTMMMRP